MRIVLAEEEQDCEETRHGTGLIPSEAKFVHLPMVVMTIIE